MIREMARGDFRRARRKAFWRAITSWFRRSDNALLAFDEVRKQLRADAQREGGVHAIPVEQVVGSVGRYRDFDRAFLPRQARTRDRWESVDTALYNDTELPPIEVYKIGETYFVKDGNHRVSVARERGQHYIDAHVIEITSPAPIRSAEDVLEWLRHTDGVAFYATTRLRDLRPEARIELTLPGQYEKLLEHISTHRWFLGIEQKREIPYSEAVTSWYDRVYLPTVEAIRRADALRDFPHRTEADLYLWVTDHHWYLHEAGLPSEHGLDEIVGGYVREHTENPIKRVVRGIDEARPLRRKRRT